MKCTGGDVGAYGVYEAKTKLADLIKRVQQGERITITNRGTPVADLVPSASSTMKQTLDAIAAIKSARKGSITQDEFKDLRRAAKKAGVALYGGISASPAP